jgi:hypothetical protein
VQKPGKDRRRVQARSLLCYWAVNGLRKSQAGLARSLHPSPAGTTLSVKRGEAPVQQLGRELLELVRKLKKRRASPKPKGPRSFGNAPASNSNLSACVRAVLLEGERKPPFNSLRLYSCSPAGLFSSGGAMVVARPLMNPVQGMPSPGGIAGLFLKKRPAARGPLLLTVSTDQTFQSTDSLWH